MITKTFKNLITLAGCEVIVATTNPTRLGRATVQ